MSSRPGTSDDKVEDQPKAPHQDEEGAWEKWAGTTLVYIKLKENSHHTKTLLAQR
jgi:hypothetical protein